MNYSAQELSKYFSCQAFVCQPDLSITQVLIDSRTQALENTVFFALHGPRNDGHDYIKDLISKGVKNFVVEHDLPYPNINYWKVKNTQHALQEFAKKHRLSFKKPILAITGSNGKTMIKEWLYEMLWDELYVVKSPKSYNSQIGVPLSVLQIDALHQLGVFEAGISKKGEMIHLASILSPTYGIFTNIGPAHEEGFGSIEEKIKEKLILFSNVKKLIYCADYSEIDASIKKQKIASFTWSKISKKADLWVENIIKNAHSTEITCRIQSKSFSFQIPFIDHASIENSIHCVAFLTILGFSSSQIQEKTARLRPVSMRLELKEGNYNTIIINDTYNADLASLKIALDFMQEHQSAQKHSSVVLSDMMEIRNPARFYDSLLQLLVSYKIQTIYAVGSSIKQFLKNSSFKNVYFYDSTQHLLDFFHHKPPKNSIVLIKGARTFHLEQIAQFLEKKVHQTTLEVNLNALAHNFHYYKTLVKPNTKIMAMLKAQSYGSGSFEIAKTLEYNKVDYIGVAYIDEGVELRQKGILTPIMVMNPEGYRYDILVKYSLEPVIYSVRIIDEISDFLHQHKKLKIKAHLEIDTGMHRLGISMKDLPNATKKMALIPRLSIVSVFSHLSSSDHAADDMFTQRQANKFSKAIKVVRKSILNPFFTHLSNSSGIERFNNLNFDMVRLGIGLYGISSIPMIQKNLQSINTLKTSISLIQPVMAGESVGYTTKNKAQKNIKIATLPIGYADGIHRVYGNGKTSFFVRGHWAPTIGNICMDMCMIDISDIPEVQEGDEVIVFSSSESIHKISKSIGTIPYEILTSISNRVKRIYFNE